MDHLYAVIEVQAGPAAGQPDPALRRAWRVHGATLEAAQLVWGDRMTEAFAYARGLAFLHADGVTWWQIFTSWMPEALEKERADACP